MKNVTLKLMLFKAVFLIAVVLTAATAANDPNTPIIPPGPGDEAVSVIDNNTLRVTTSRDVTKASLLRRKADLLNEIAVIDEKLEMFK